MAEAAKSESVLDRGLGIVGELLVRADATWFWAGWVLGVVVEGELVVGTDELFDVEVFCDSWPLGLPVAWAGGEIEISACGADEQGCENPMRIKI